MSLNPSNLILYHYCSFEDACCHILPAMQLRLGPLHRTNDPRENQTLVFGASMQNTETSPTVEDVLEMNRAVSQMVREDCKILCFSTDKELRGYQLSQMWAHYGAKHTGICIAIDFDKFKAENPEYFKKGYFHPVQYVDPVTYVKQNIEQRYKQVDMERFNNDAAQYIKTDFRMKNLEYLFFTKSIEWEHEQECRFVYFGDPGMAEYCSISESLVSILVGVDFEKDTIPVLQRRIDKHIPIWQLFYTGEGLAPRADLNESRNI